LSELRGIAARPGDRARTAQQLADVIRRASNVRWVGIYDVDLRRGIVSNIAWSGPGAPAHPVFPSTHGLTARAIATRTSVNVGDVTRDPHYLTAFGSTRSEIIVPVMDETGMVLGTIDVEGEMVNAFDPATQAFLESCAEAIRELWRIGGRTNP
jgi:putative methionine-R-sulfoxide reductase with GAF domain